MTRNKRRLVLKQNIAVNSGDRIAIIGSGGKTTLLTRLAENCPGLALMSTTTHLQMPRRGEYASDYERTRNYPGEFIPFGDCDELHLALQKYGNKGAVLTARCDRDNFRLTGLSAAELDVICTWPELDLVVVEADGSRGLPIKAHASHEPALFSACNLGIAVIGMRALGREVAEGRVHRSELLRELLHCDAEHRLTAGDLAVVALSYLRQFSCSRRYLVLSQCEGCTRSNLQLVAEAVQSELGDSAEPWAENVQLYVQYCGAYI